MNQTHAGARIRFAPDRHESLPTPTRADVGDGDGDSSCPRSDYNEVPADRIVGYLLNAFMSR